MSSELAQQFPNPENQPPGRAAFEIACRALDDEEVKSQLTSKSIQAMYQASDGFAVSISCGYVDNFDTQEQQFLLGEIEHSTGKAFSLDEFSAPGGLEAFLGSELPAERLFRRGQEPEGDMNDEDFDKAMRNFQEELSPGTVAWIHEALRIIQLPAEHSSSRARIEEIIRLAETTPEVPLQLDTLTTMKQIRVVGGLSLEAFWRESNKVALERNNDHLTKTRIKLDRIGSDGQCYFYIRDAHGNETVAAEIADPAEREVLSTIGYDIHDVGDWHMWDKDIANFGIVPPPDSALEDFARRVQDTLNAPRLGENDRYVRSDDGTIKVRRPDGTVY